MGLNVYEASIKRIDYCLDNFEKYYIALSGGKDSGVLFSIAIQRARIKNKKIGVLIVDTEAHYDYTYSFLESVVNENLHFIELFWVCLPLSLDNTLSSFSSNWICWDKNLKENWIREQNKLSITDYNYFPFFSYGMTFYDFIENFAEWYANDKKLCCFIGLRAEESHTRNKIFISSKGNYIFKNTTNSFNSYPLFDWKYSDIWKYNYITKSNYNKIYDLMQMAGVPILHQRVGQLFGNEQKRFLSITRVIDHKVWVKMLYRVNGVDFTSRILDSGALKNISKPIGKSWEQFCLFISDTLQNKQKYLVKTRIKELVKEFKKRDYIEIPEEAPKELENARKVISWRMICKSLLKNDFNFNGYGVTFKTSKNYERYKNIKYIEENTLFK